jgi:hypothetical protein
MVQNARFMKQFVMALEFCVRDSDIYSDGSSVGRKDQSVVCNGILSGCVWEGNGFLCERRDHLWSPINCRMKGTDFA